MLNRYGLFEFDMEKFLREQDEPQDPATAGAPPATPPPPAEDPNEKIDKAREKNEGDDLASFRKQHADTIYQIADAYGDKDREVDTDASLRDLRQKFDTSGADDSFFVLFDPATSGLDGPKHLSLIAWLHHNGDVTGNQVKFHSAGDASSFVEGASSIRPDLALEVNPRDPTAVTVSSAQVQQPGVPGATPGM
jgi:hypothetical protein